MFEINEKIICVDDTIKPELLFSIIRDFKIWIKKGIEYTIRDVLYNDNIVTGILLQEVHNPPIMIPLLNRMQEPAFATWRFRKKTYQELEEEKVEEKKEYILSPSIVNDIEKLTKVFEIHANR